MGNAFIFQLKQYKNCFDRPFFINHSARFSVMPEILSWASFTSKIISVYFIFTYFMCLPVNTTPPPPFLPLFFAVTYFFCNHFEELQTELFKVELIANNAPLT